MLNRRDFLRMGGLCTASLLAGCRVTPERKTAERPNIVFIMTDDHASHAVGCYGSRINKTPQIDRLAREGMRFENCFCTNSICSPSRAVILTGKYSHLNGMIVNIYAGRPFDGSQQTYPKLLQKAGYETAMIGKWHLGSDPTGFDYWEVLPGQGSYYNPDFIQMDGSRKQYEGYCTDIITDLSIDWLKERRDSAKPFLLITQHKAPHRCWSPAPRHLGKYKHGTIPEPDTLFPDHAKRSAASAESEMSVRDHFRWGHDMKFRGENLFPDHFVSQGAHNEYSRMTPAQRQQWDAHYEPENHAFVEQMQAGKLTDDDVVRWKYQRYMHDYLGSVEAVDEGVGRLLDTLEETGLADNTIVVYTSDQGFYLGDQGWYDKRFMYEESLRMPLLIRWPQQVRRGAVSDAMVLNLDFAATFLDAAGAAVPADIQGESFVPILRGRRPANWRKAMYYHYYEYPAVHQVKRHYGIRTERYKLIHFYYDIDAWELYDLRNDPHEWDNLYDDPKYTRLVKRLKAELAELRARYGDSDELARSFLPPSG
ncbi:sulfatase family protein [Anaerobaca lacustris]|uniref:Sulfatase n=1 Tax=Anaerobaca lacustris TaxID=3044600 RepID=A0AAW6TZA0_9BACT|nr:sulfatase [Sedimentisphaerales bacterium M17dextr]